MTTPPLTAEVRIKVPFFDVDPMQIVWHGHYVKYFELARCELLEKLDYGYREMARTGYGWPVIDLHLRYIKSATLGQEIICTATLVEHENRLKIAYEIFCASTRVRLTKGHSIQVAVSIEDKEMQLVSPPVLFEKLRNL
jgi:acyl-CoA thioester hydrolase